MLFFVDSADVEQIRKLNNLSLCDGVTTNPTLIKQAGKDHAREGNVYSQPDEKSEEFFRYNVSSGDPVSDEADSEKYQYCF